jgi:hypothetical protein
MTTATENSHNAQQSTSMIKIKQYRVHEDKETIRSDEIEDLENKVKNVEFMTEEDLVKRNKLSDRLERLQRFERLDHSAKLDLLEQLDRMLHLDHRVDPGAFAAPFLHSDARADSEWFESAPFVPQIQTALQLPSPPDSRQSSVPVLAALSSDKSSSQSSTGLWI